ncbi:hypothetical protein DFH09DRAFT_1329745 [Mycena vulgaris]|nr:hypothetical protein DFH09DRAFT_1329745 [Mycena vulgaris]
MPADSDADAPYGHILSSKSTELARDTFLFFILPGPAQLILGTSSIRSTYFVKRRVGLVGTNQKLIPVSSATLHRWVYLMGEPDEPEREELYLCPVSVHSVGIVAALPPRNYGCYLTRNAQVNAFPEDPIPPEITEIVLPRDENRCIFTGAVDDLTMAWIFPPEISWEALTATTSRWTWTKSTASSSCARWAPPSGSSSPISLPIHIRTTTCVIDSENPSCVPYRVGKTACD